MPWCEVSVMSLRGEFCALASQPDAAMSVLCRRFGISRKTGYKWLARYQTEGAAGLADQSRRPHGSPWQTSAADEAAIVAAARQHPVWGPRKLHHWLRQQGMAAVPAPSTISAIVTRTGTRTDPLHTPRPPWQRFVAEQPNHLWQLDFKGPVSIRGTLWHPLLVLDDHSRYVLAVHALPNQQTSTVQVALTTIFQRYGLPWRMLCDNGPPWGTAHPSGLTTLGAWCLRLGIAVIHGRPYHPQTQGKIERFGRTLGAEVLTRSDWSDATHLQDRLDAWRELYNVERPHAALGHQPPIVAYRPSPRSFPDPLPPLWYEPDDLVRIVTAQGYIALHGQRYYVSEAIPGQPVAIRRTPDPLIVQITYGAMAIRRIHLRADIRQTKRATIAP